MWAIIEEGCSFSWEDGTSLPSSGWIRFVSEEEAELATREVERRVAACIDAIVPDDWKGVLLSGASYCASDEA